MRIAINQLVALRTARSYHAVCVPIVSPLVFLVFLVSFRHHSYLYLLLLARIYNSPTDKPEPHALATPPRLAYCQREKSKTHKYSIFPQLYKQLTSAILHKHELVSFCCIVPLTEGFHSVNSSQAVRHVLSTFRRDR